MPGGLVCAKHGGNAPQVREAARRRHAQEQAMLAAQRMVQRAGVDVDPIEHLLDSLHVATQLMHVWGSMAAAIDDAADRELERGAIRGELGYVETTDPESRDELFVMSRDRMLALNAKGEAQIHPYVLEYERAVERRARFAKLCIDAGIAERQVRIMEEQVAVAQKALDATLEQMGLDAGQRQDAKKTYARNLRLVA